MVHGEVIIPRLRQASPCMGRLERLQWVAGFALRVYGVSLGIRVNDADIIPLLKERLPYSSRIVTLRYVEQLYSVILARKPRPAIARYGGAGRPGVRRGHSIYGQAVEVARTEKLSDLLDAFQSDIRLLVAENARDRVFVHAGVVGWRGRAIVIPGLSFSGKTTLVAEFLRAGATYYSDEFAVVDARGRVYPYVKPLSIRRPGETLQTDIPPDSFGARVSTRPVPISAVIVTEFKDSASWRPRVLSPGERVLALLSHSVAARRFPERALAYLATATSAAIGLKSRRGDAARTAALILESLT